MVFSMNDNGARKFLPILKESPIYSSLSPEEKEELLQRLAETYPEFEGDVDDQYEDYN